MKILPLEISGADQWKGCSRDNNLFYLYSKSSGSDTEKISKLISAIRKANENGILSEGSKYGIFIKDNNDKTFKLWWDKNESSLMDISIEYNLEYSTRVILERDGFTVLGVNSNGLHSEDGPALISSDNTKYYYKDGLKHNSTGPAVIHENGSEEWFMNGKELTDEEAGELQLKIIGFSEEDISVLDMLDLK